MRLHPRAISSGKLCRYRSEKIYPPRAISWAINKLHKNRLCNKGPGQVLLNTVQSPAQPAVAIKTSSPTGISPTSEIVKHVKNPARNDIQADGDSHTLPGGNSSADAFASRASGRKSDGEIRAGEFMVQCFAASTVHSASTAGVLWWTISLIISATLCPAASQESRASAASAVRKASWR